MVLCLLVSLKFTSNFWNWNDQILTKIIPEGEQRMCHWKMVVERTAFRFWKGTLQGRITHPTLAPKENHRLKINGSHVSSQVTFQVLYFAGILQVAIFFQMANSTTKRNRVTMSLPTHSEVAARSLVENWVQKRRRNWMRSWNGRMPTCNLWFCWFPQKKTR